ncbi:hypothetical protein CMI37_36270 [Candidatus Pacearchaeota archaeon]|nr:hypothetical protein [Candidatus Pacearchaeota archaeon]
MGTPWVRIDVDFRDDPDLVMGGWEAVALWPQVVAALKRADGALTARDLEVFPVVERIPREVWVRALDHYRSVGLIVEGSCVWTSQGKGEGVNKSKAGWVTPRLAEKGNGPSRSTSEIIVRNGVIPSDVERSEVEKERTEEKEDNIFNIVPRALSRPVLSCPSRVRGSGGEGSSEDSLSQYMRATWGDKCLLNKKPLEDWVAAQNDLHPNLDLLVEAKKARAYEESKGKYYKNARLGLNRWFNNAEKFKAENSTDHWSGLNKSAREQEIAAGNTSYRSNVNGVSLWRDLRDDGYVLSAQDVLNPELPYMEAVRAAAEAAVGESGDPYDHEQHVKALVSLGARAENSQNLTFAIDQIVAELKGGAA